jgi:hypothetical protein
MIAADLVGSHAGARMGDGARAGSPMRTGAAFYLVTTPYHLLLALAHVEAARVPATLFLFGRFADCERYWAFLAADPLSASVHLVGALGVPTDRRPRARARRLLLDAVRAQRPAELFVFNDRNEVAQAALDAVARQGGRRTCLEDGSSFYTDWLAPEASRWTTLRKRWLTTRTWLPLRVLGTHPLVQEVRVMRPSLVRPELQGRAKPLELDLLRSPVLHRLATAMVPETASGMDARPDVLVLPGLEDDPGWSAWLQGWCEAVPGAPVAFKYHPREPRKDPAGLARIARELPRHVAAELYYLAWGGTPQRVFGDGRSTTLLTTKLFDPDCEVVGIYRGELPPHAAAFSRLGIAMNTCLPAEAP